MKSYKDYIEGEQSYDAFLNKMMENARVAVTPVKNALSFDEYYAGINPVASYGETKNAIDTAAAKASPNYGQAAESIAQSGLGDSGYKQYLGGEVVRDRNAQVATAAGEAMSQIGQMAQGYAEYVGGVRNSNITGAQKAYEEIRKRVDAGADTETVRRDLLQNADYAPYVADGFKQYEEQMKVEQQKALGQKVEKYIGELDESKEIRSTEGLDKDIAGYVAQDIINHNDTLIQKEGYGTYDTYKGELKEYVEERLDRFGDFGFSGLRSEYEKLSEEEKEKYLKKIYDALPDDERNEVIRRFNVSLLEKGLASETAVSIANGWGDNAGKFSGNVKASDYDTIKYYLEDEYGDEAESKFNKMTESEKAAAKYNALTFYVNHYLISSKQYREILNNAIVKSSNNSGNLRDISHIAESAKNAYERGMISEEANEEVQKVYTDYKKKYGDKEIVSARTYVYSDDGGDTTYLEVNVFRDGDKDTDTVRIGEIGAEGTPAYVEKIGGKEFGVSLGGLYVKIDGEFRRVEFNRKLSSDKAVEMYDYIMNKLKQHDTPAKKKTPTAAETLKNNTPYKEMSAKLPITTTTTSEPVNAQTTSSTSNASTYFTTDAPTIKKHGDGFRIKYKTNDDGKEGIDIEYKIDPNTSYKYNEKFDKEKFIPAKLNGTTITVDDKTLGFIDGKLYVKLGKSWYHEAKYLDSEDNQKFVDELKEMN